ncbi:hypothetical protein GFK32_20780, partial [Salmonella enterica subsp. enterica serovar Enteritidis]|nr:hypothetical protein [Salmonella enterica subsp. enterica serovar Enteritidis]
MSSVPAPREYFLDSIRAWLMLLGIPFHISLIYSTHSWHVNSATPSWWLTLFNSDKAYWNNLKTPFKLE